jgi:uncharacterized coiled-coil protein SlyX
MSMQIDWKIDLGRIITFIVVVLGFAAQYGSLSTRLTAVELQAAKASVTNEALNVTLNSLRDTIIRVQTQMDEREKRFDAQTAAQNLREDRREVSAARSK